MHEIGIVRALFREYADSLGIDLCFQSFERELAELPGAYAPPRGCLLLAKSEGTAIGCAALRPLSAGACEMKRLFVRSAFHSRGLGRKLTETVIGEARAMGYQWLRLDTIPQRMTVANALYNKLGFVAIPPYYECPVPGVQFFELSLRPSLPRSAPL